MLESELELPEEERIDFVSIVTPNHLHFPVAHAFAEAGFNVVLDKPMVHTSEQAQRLVDVVEKTSVVFAVTYNYSGYPLVKQARYMVQEGQLGEVRKVIVEYNQGWLATRLEDSGAKQAEWRTDPARSGIAGAVGDIGSHAENLVSTVTGFEVSEICADLTTFVEGRRLDDDANLLIRYTDGAKGVLIASQISAGEENDLRIRVYGTEGGLEWRQEEPNYGTYPLDGSTAIWYTFCMSKVDRNNPKRSSASESRYSLMEFMEQFPDDDTCLEYLVAKLYPDGIYCPTCGRITKHHREKNRPSYACQYCGHHEHPLVGTIFENSATSLRLWFYAIYLMSSTRCGISAKQLERELGVTYKTAWRMFHKIRSLLDQGDPLFDGPVEADEAYIGGAAKWRNKGIPENKGRGPVDKTPVFGMAQRGKEDQYGQIVAKVVDDAGAKSILPHVRTKVLPESVVYTDEAMVYRHNLQDMGYQHDWVSHTNNVYVSGDVHTNTIDGFWTHLKRGVSGVYRGVSPKHLQSYLDEYVFRYNNRGNERGLFMAFLDRIEKVQAENPGPSLGPSSS